jgi:hypothetical protein
MSVHEDWKIQAWKYLFDAALEQIEMEKKSDEVHSYVLYIVVILGGGKWEQIF